MQTDEQRNMKAGQTVHIYYDPKTNQYGGFRLFTEREDKESDEPK
jgi:hypothetical protein